MIKSETPQALLKDGWLQISPEWLAGVFNCRYGGLVLVTDSGHLLVKIRHPSLEEGEPVMEGTVIHAQVPAGLQFKRASGPGPLGKVVIGRPTTFYSTEP